MTHIQSQLKVQGHRVFFGEDFIERETLIDLLSAQLTFERIDRIDQVIQGRTDEVQPVLEHIYDHGNVNAVMRSAEAFGFYKLHVIDQPSGQFKLSNRVSGGTEKWVSSYRHKSNKDCINDLKAQGILIYSTHLGATQSIDKVDFSKPCAIVLGNEKDGVTQETLEASDESFMIPISGFVQSFNISVAASLCFYHIYQWRLNHCGKESFINQDKCLWLKLDYIINTLGGVEKLNTIIKHYFKTKL